MDFNNKTITITFGDQAENHVGMQKIGQKADSGFTIDDLKNAKINFEKAGCVCELHMLNDNKKLKKYKLVDAAVLVIKNGVDMILKSIGKNANDMYNEQFKLNWDTKALMYGRVVNKHARYNLCYSDFAQEPDYANGKGRVVNFNTIPLTKKIHESLDKYIGNKSNNLAAEGNLYHDLKTCGIGWHGDSERFCVVGVRLGTSTPIYYNWFIDSGPIGDRISINLDHGDIYIMSEKAVGNDWKSKINPTLRHSAGADKYTKIEKKPKKVKVVKKPKVKTDKISDKK